MSIPSDQRYYLKLKALYYYYEKGYSYTDISKMLDISRVTLNRLMAEAKAEGMVKIEIVDSRKLRELFILEDSLRSRYDLKDVHLVDVPSYESENLIARLSSEGARYVRSSLRSGMKVGISWGQTLRTMLTNMSRDPSVCGLEVYTLLGGACSEANFQPTLLAQGLLERYEGSAYTINAPFVCHSELLCSEIRKEPDIAKILGISPELDLALVGIGQYPDRERLEQSYYHFPPHAIDEIIASGAVGDICGNFYDEEGRPCLTEISRRMVAIELRELQKCRNVIAIAGGPLKVRSIRGALCGGYVDTLITDVNTAEAILAADR